MKVEISKEITITMSGYHADALEAYLGGTPTKHKEEILGSKASGELVSDIYNGLAALSKQA